MIGRQLQGGLGQSIIPGEDPHPGEYPIPVIKSTMSSQVEVNSPTNQVPAGCVQVPSSVFLRLCNWARSKKAFSIVTIQVVDV